MIHDLGGSTAIDMFAIQFKTKQFLSELVVNKSHTIESQHVLHLSSLYNLFPRNKFLA